VSYYPLRCSLFFQLDVSVSLLDFCYDDHNTTGLFLACWFVFVLSNLCHHCSRLIFFKVGLVLNNLITVFGFISCFVQFPGMKNCNQQLQILVQKETLVSTRKGLQHLITFPICIRPTIGQGKNKQYCTTVSVSYLISKISDIFDRIGEKEWNGSATFLKENILLIVQCALKLKGCSHNH
jgi:hypothetical protein